TSGCSGCAAGTSVACAVSKTAAGTGAGKGSASTAPGAACWRETTTATANNAAKVRRPTAGQIQRRGMGEALGEAVEQERPPHRCDGRSEDRRTFAAA